jgi:hypothetical protein
MAPHKITLARGPQTRSLSTHSRQRKGLKTLTYCSHMDRLHSRRLAATHSTNPATRKGAAPSSYFKQQSMEEAGSGKGGRTYIHSKHKRRPLLQQPQEEAAATQEEAAASNHKRRPLLHKRRPQLQPQQIQGGRSHSKHNKAAATEKEISASSQER